MVIPEAPPWLGAPKPVPELPLEGAISRPRKAVAPMWTSADVVPASICSAIDRASLIGIE